MTRSDWPPTCSTSSTRSRFSDRFSSEARAPGETCTSWGAKHPDLVAGLVYLDAAEDNTLTMADYSLPPVDMAHVPAALHSAQPADDFSSFAAYRAQSLRQNGWSFPEAELRFMYAANPDGSMGRALLNLDARRVITEEARIKPDYAHIGVPALAVFRTMTKEQVLAERPPKNDVERAALDQAYAAGRTMLDKWQRDVRQMPNVRIVELPGANLYMFVSNETDILRELRTFAATLAPQEIPKRYATLRGGMPRRPNAAASIR